MKRAFILSRPRDIEIAEACKTRMMSLGWTAVVMVDPTEWETPPEASVHAAYGTQNRGMFGNACASAIMAGMIAGSQPGDVVMKMDCDVWLSAEMADWLGNAEHKARAMRIHYRQLMPWGGVWVAKRETVIAANEHAQTYARCRCPESGLNLKALAQTSGLELCPGIVVTQWVVGQDRGMAATLPICRRINRKTEGLALFTVDERIEHC